MGILEVRMYTIPTLFSFFTVALAALIPSISVEPLSAIPIAAQDNITAITNRTTEETKSLQNQSTPTITSPLDPLLNLTRQDLDPILNNLFTAREELLHHRVVPAFEALNRASSELLKINLTQSSVDNGADDLNLRPLERQIELARTSLQNNNITVTIKLLNGADTEFIILSQELPSPDSDQQDFVKATTADQ